MFTSNINRALLPNQARYSQTNYMAAEMLTATPDVLSDAAAIKKDAAKQVPQVLTASPLFRSCKHMP